MAAEIDRKAQQIDGKLIIIIDSVDAPFWRWKLELLRWYIFEIPEYLDFVYSLLNKAQRGFHDMFTRTYGIMYQKNANVFQVNKKGKLLIEEKARFDFSKNVFFFQDYFNDLKVYYDRGTLDLGDTTSNFFNILYQKMFQVFYIYLTISSIYLPGFRYI